MSRSLRARLIALLASSAVAFSVLVPGAAFADEVIPSPTPTVEPSVEPTPEPTPTAEPTDAPTAEPTAVPEPTATPTATPEPSATPTPAAATTIAFTGVFTRLSSEDRVAGTAPDAPLADDASVLFTVPGSGFLRADVSQLPADIASGTVTVRFAVPVGLELSADESAAFLQLATYSTTTAPLVAVSVTAGRGVAQRATPFVNQTPNTAAVHEIFAVLVTPNSGGKGADQTAAGVATSVAGANDYWSQQSTGSVQFHLAGTTSWYSSANSCATDAGSTALWNQAASIAAAQLGYVAARNVHLVLFFPSSFMSSCGGAVGLGTIGWSANEGGAAWVIGTGASGANAGIAQGILSHELGHNLSFGHANWAQCPGTAPAFNNDSLIDNCSLQPYGDAVDVMGYSQNNRTGGALSSAQAIRGNLWPASDYENAPVGTTDYVLAAVSTNAGLRSVVVEDPYGGDRFFIEFRNYTGEDAPYSTTGCNGYLCVASTPGVRVLRFDDDYRFIGFPGDDSYVLGRSSAGGSTRINYVAGETFKAEGASFDPNPQVKVEVLSISGNTATVRVTRPPLGSSPTSQLVRTDFVSIVPTVTYDSRLRVGDVWTANLGSYWSAETYAFQWYRNNVPISGATAPSYTIAAADLGKSIRVAVTGSSTGASPATRSDPEDGFTGYGPIVKGIYRSDLPGSVAVDNAAAPLTAQVADWPSGTTFAYQWMRGATAATATTAVGAGGSSYLLSAADVGQFVRVRVIATVPGFDPVTRYSSAANYSVAATGSLAVAGAVAVGLPLTITNALAYTSQGHAVTPTSFDYQWLRNGIAIAGATAGTYTTAPADFGTKISVRVIAYTPGYAPNTSVSVASAAIGKGNLTGTFAIPEVTKGSPFTLTAALPAGAIDTPDTTKTYQWFRGAVAIAGATAATYAPTSADYGQLVSVKVTVSKLNYNPLTLQSTPINYSVVPSVGTPTITGELRLTEPVTVTDRTYVAGGAPTAAVEAVQWYRNGVAIPGPLGTGATYVVVTADLGKSLTARVTASVDGFLPAIGTSTPTQLVGSSSFDGWNAQDFAGVAVTPSTNTLTVTGTGITGPGVPTLAYQWFRGTTAVAGSIKNTYALTAADYGLPVWVRVTTSRTGFTTIVKESTKVDYSITGDAPVISSTTGPFRVGVALSADSSAFTTKDGAVTPTLAYAWFRNGVVIAGATASTYLPVAADLATKLTVRVTATSPGYVAKVATSAATVPLAKGEIEGSFAAPTVAAAPTGVLTASVPAGSVTTAAPTTTWQWFRNGVAITGATAATFALTAADYGKTISVRATISKVNYTNKVLDSAALDYSVVPSGLPALSGATAATPRVGDTLGVTLPTYSTKDAAAAPVVAYQWLRNGVVIAGATQPMYVVLPSDLGSSLTARVTAPLPGYVASVTVTPTLGAVAKGELTVDPAILPVVSASPQGLLVAAILPGTVSQPNPTLTYQWLRNGANVVGATGATYTLTAADNGKLISVKMAASKLGMISTAAVPLTESDRIDYSIFLTDTVDPLTPFVYTIQGETKVSETLSVTLPDYSTREGAVTPTLAYQWFRGATLIAGATQPTYVVQPADFGLKLQVRVTATTPRAIASIALSSVTGSVIAGIIQGFDSPVVSTSATAKLSVVVPTTAPTTPGVTFAYQWFRGTATIPGATAATFQLSALDIAKPISVRVTISKPASGPAVVRTSAETNYSVQTTTPDALPEVTGTTQVSEVLSVSLPDYSNHLGSVTPTYSYVWLRNDVAIPGATGATYLLQPADVNTRTSVRVTASVPGFLASILTSGKVGPVAVGVLKDFGTPVVTTSATGKLTATVPTVPTTTPGATFAYQWLRDSVVIAGATASTFQLTSLDYGKPIAVRVTVTKASSDTLAPLFSDPTNYSVTADAPPSVDTLPQVGQTLAATLPTYSAGGGTVTPTFTYVWLRNNVAIPGATAATYVVASSDWNQKFSVRVTATVPGYVALVATSPQTVAIQLGFLEVAAFGPTVTRSATGLLTASVPSNWIVTPATTTTYQWLRNASPVVGATAKTYQLTAADAGASIVVVFRVTKPNMQQPFEERTSDPMSYTVIPSSPLVISGDAIVGQTLTAYAPSFSTPEGPAAYTVAYQWFRNNVAVAGATGTNYLVQAADVNARFSVRVTGAIPGWVASIRTSAQTDPVVTGTLNIGTDLPVVTASAAGLLTASLPTIVSVGTTSTYQWYRAGVAIVGATTNKYQLLATDSGKLIRVRVTVSKAGVTPSSAYVDSDGVDYGISAPDDASIDGAARVGVQLSVLLPTYSVSVTPTYQWLRAGVAIPGATSPTYITALADQGKVVSVRLTAALPGMLALVKIAATSVIGPGTFTGIPADPIIDDATGGVLTARLDPASVLEPGITLAYQWYRNGTAITGATAATYTLDPTLDYATATTVRITVTKPGYTAGVFGPASTAYDFTILTSGVPGFTTATIGVGDVVGVGLLPSYSNNGSSYLPDSSYLRYQWFLNGVAVLGAAGSSATYTVPATAAGKQLTVKVLVVDGGYLSRPVMSDPVVVDVP